MQLNEETKDDNEETNDTEISLFNPIGLLDFLCFNSPVIVAIIITFLSFVNQNFKGFIYLAFLIAISIVRLYIYKYNNYNGDSVNKRCNQVVFSKYGNLTFSSFVFAYTITYISIPMFSNNIPNFAVFSGLVAYFLIDLFYKNFRECYNSSHADLLLNVVSGVGVASIIVALLYSGGSEKYLFFNEIVSNNTMCYKPKNQTFKCSVYKDGTLVGNL